MKLIINAEKTKIYDLTKERMKYLGYEFYVRDFICKTKKGVSKVSNLLPKSKEDEIVERCRELLKAIKKKTSFDTIHAWNTYVIGLHNYYGGMTHFYQCFWQIGWRIYKLFYHTMNKRVKFTKEQGYKNGFMRGKYSTWGTKGYYCFETYPIIEIKWANWDSTLIDYKKSIIRKNPYDYGKLEHKPGVSLEDIDYLVNTSSYIKNSRLAMLRISKYSSVKGKSYMSGEYVPVENYHCHHVVPKEKGGTHDFDNLCVLSKTEHIILHGAKPEILYEMFPKKTKRIEYLINQLNNCRSKYVLNSPSKGFQGVKTLTS